MAVKIIDVVVTSDNTEINWNGLQSKYSNWNEVSKLSDWKDVRRIGIQSPLTVTVGTQIKVTVSAIDIDWKAISENFHDWSAVSTDFTNWKSILNYH